MPVNINLDTNNKKWVKQTSTHAIYIENENVLP